MGEFELSEPRSNRELDKVFEIEKKIVDIYPKKKKDRYEARRIATEYAKAALVFAEKNPGVINEVNFQTNVSTDYQLTDIEKWKTAIESTYNNKWNIMKKALKDTSKNLSSDEDPETKKISKAINNLANSL